MRDDKVIMVSLPQGHNWFYDLYMKAGERMFACFELRETYYPHSVIEGGMECISYPFPDASGGISVMIRVKDEPNTIHEVKIVESDWRKRP